MDNKQLQDLVNAGIGLYKAGEENLQGRNLSSRALKSSSELS